MTLFHDVLAMLLVLVYAAVAWSIYDSPYRWWFPLFTLYCAACVASQFLFATGLYEAWKIVIVPVTGLKIAAAVEAVMMLLAPLEPGSSLRWKRIIFGIGGAWMLVSLCVGLVERYPGFPPWLYNLRFWSGAAAAGLCAATTASCYLWPFGRPFRYTMAHCFLLAGICANTAIFMHLGTRMPSEWYLLDSIATLIACGLLGQRLILTVSHARAPQFSASRTAFH